MKEPELKLCGNCGGEGKMQAPNMHRRTCVTCKECGMSTGYGTPEEVAATWNRRTPPTPSNAPLALEELRGMDGEPVYLVFDPDADGDGLKMWALVEVDADGGEVYLTNNLGGRTGFLHPKNIDGMTIYRCPPEKGE